MTENESTHEKRSEAGRKGAERRWDENTSSGSARGSSESTHEKLSEAGRKGGESLSHEEHVRAGEAGGVAPAREMRE
jgi:general stress protein YciG